MTDEQQPGRELATRDELAEMLRQEQETNLLLVETMSELEAALETDASWNKISSSDGSEFTGAGRKLMADLCRTVAVVNPLIKRGLNLRIAYIWGSAERSGLQIQARDEDVNEVVQKFWDDNTRSLTGSQAQEELERALGTDGNVYLAAFTSALTGRVRVRSVPSAEICGIISNPEDRDEPWFYIREYTRQVLEGGYDATNTRPRNVTDRVAYPALGYTPARRVKVVDRATVKWDAPMQHIAVNRLDGWQFGIPDVYAAMAWARAYKDFLTDWALLTKSLARFAWRVAGDTKSRTAKAAAAIRASTDPTLLAPNGTLPPAGATAAMGPGNVLEAIPKSGAHIDAESGKPLAAMVASGLGLPVTLLLADPGVTGARAVAETLRDPTVLEMGMRRMLWQDHLSQLLDYAVDCSAIAPKGKLKGTTTVDEWGLRVTELAGDKDRNVDFNWPPMAKLDPIALVQAIVAADSTAKLPVEVIARLLLQALGVEDVDEILEDMKDDQGNFVDPNVSAGQAAADAFNRGKDPAAALASDGQPSA